MGETIVYEIIKIWEEEGGNWHNGFQKLLYVKLDEEPKPYLLAYKIIGGVISIYNKAIDSVYLI
jgi:hypothetical protein